MDEKRLAKRAMHGNPDAYGQLIELYKEGLYRTAFLHVKNEETALDLVSETIVRGYESVKKVRHPEYFKTWLFRILLNAVSDYFRKKHETCEMELLEQTPAKADSSVEERMDLARAIDLLPEKYKSVIILKYYNDMKISEIAKAIDAPEGTVKAYLHNGKETLKHYLKQVMLDKIDLAFAAGQPILYGEQTEDGAFEGIIRMGLYHNKLMSGKTEDLYINLNWFTYREVDIDGYYDHVLADEEGYPVRDENMNLVMDDGIERHDPRHNETGNWDFCIPVTIDTESIRTYEIHSEDNRCGVENVKLTPYELQIEAWHPTDLDGNYGVAVFDQDGNRIVLGEVVDKEELCTDQTMGAVYVYPVREQEWTKLHIYIAKGEHEAYKETDEQAMKERALYYTEVILE